MARPTDDLIRKEIFGKIQTQELYYDDIILRLERFPNLSAEVELSSGRSDFEIKEGISKKTGKPSHILLAKIHHVHQIENWREPAVFPFDDLWAIVTCYPSRLYSPKGSELLYHYDLEFGIGAEPYQLIFTDIRMEDKAAFEAFLTQFRELVRTHPSIFAYNTEE